MNGIIVAMTTVVAILFAWVNRLQKQIDVQEARVARARLALLLVTESMDEGRDTGNLHRVVAETLSGMS